MAGGIDGKTPGAEGEGSTGGHSSQQARGTLLQPGKHKRKPLGQEALPHFLAEPGGISQSSGQVIKPSYLSHFSLPHSGNTTDGSGRLTQPQVLRSQICDDEEQTDASSQQLEYTSAKADFGKNNRYINTINTNLNPQSLFIIF
jgi:hypothetical protein